MCEKQASVVVKGLLHIVAQEVGERNLSVNGVQLFNLRGAEFSCYRESSFESKIPAQRLRIWSRGKEEKTGSFRMPSRFSSSMISW